MSTKKITLYKYISWEYVVDILDNHRLYLSDGTNFNDPFEIAVADKKNNNIRRIEDLHILSLTNSYRKKLMWSHNADSHKGVCLTIEVPNNFVYPICYSSKRIYEDTQMIISNTDYSIKVQKGVKRNNI